MSNGVSFYFVRHGETYFNFYDRMQGWSNAPLTPKGIENVHRSGRGLADVKFDAVYTSDLQRTIDTALILLEENQFNEGLKIVPMKEFREVFFGSFEGQIAKDVWPQLIKSTSIKYDLPQGSEAEIQYILNTIKELDPYHHAENYVEFWQRVESGLLQLLNKHAGTNQTILVVCHGMTIRNLLNGLIADFNKKEPLDNASVSIVEYRDGQFRLKAYGRTDHFKDVLNDSNQE